MSIYKDMDLTFERGTNGDFASIEDNTCIKNALYNNLFISSEERYFDNLGRLDFENILHGTFDHFMAKEIKDAINDAIMQDPRVRTLTDVKYAATEDGKLKIEVTAETNRSQSSDIGSTISFLLYIDVS